MKRKTSWKSTIAGFAVVVLNLLANGVSVRQAIFSASLFALGLMAKYYDVSGKPNEASMK